VRDVLYFTPIRLDLLYTANQIRIEFRTRKYFFFYKRGRSIHILGLHQHFLWVRMRILVMDEMSLEV